METSAANQAAYERLTQAEPWLVDIKPAIEAVPRMTPETVLTSGPPMAWPEYFGGQRNAIIGGALWLIHPVLFIGVACYLLAR